MGALVRGRVFWEEGDAERRSVDAERRSVDVAASDPSPAGALPTCPRGPGTLQKPLWRGVTSPADLAGLRWAVLALKSFCKEIPIPRTRSARVGSPGNKGAALRACGD